MRKVRTFALVLSAVQSSANQWPVNEDAFWAIAAPAYFPFFRKPTVELGIRFSFELQPRECFEMNHQNLPFGCHAWWKYDLDFWRPFIKQFGHVI